MSNIDRRRLKAILVGLTTWVAGMATPGTSARAEFLFAPQGGGAASALTVESFDFAAGNALAVGALPLTTGKTFQLDYQASLADLKGPNGIIATPGLNSSYQITAVASVTEIVTSIFGPPQSPTVTFALAPVQNGSFFEIYYNPAVVANPSAGTGYNVGTRIFSATPLPQSISNVGNFSLEAAPPGALDQFGPDSRPGISSVGGVGSAAFVGNMVQSDPQFFVTPLQGISFRTTNTTPFLQTNPSALFDGSPGVGSPSIVPKIGTINGASGPDFLFQTDATASFAAAVPEPSGFTLVGMGVASMLGYCLWKRMG